MCLAFTECDHIFDSTENNGNFSLPIMPSVYMTKQKSSYYAEQQKSKQDGEFDNEIHEKDDDVESEKELNNFEQKYYFENEAKQNIEKKVLPNNIQVNNKCKKN